MTRRGIYDPGVSSPRTPHARDAPNGNVCRGFMEAAMLNVTRGAEFLTPPLSR